MSPETMATNPTCSTCEVAATNTTLVRSAGTTGRPMAGSGIVSNGVPARLPVVVFGGVGILTTSVEPGPPSPR